MSNIPITDAASTTRKVDTFQRTEGPDTVETQAVAVVDPSTGAVIDFATQATMAALLTAANAIQAAAEALNTKATVINTGAVAGTVEVSNLNGLTDTQLRAAAVPVSMGAPPPGAATDAVVQSITDLTDTMVTLLSGISRKLSLPDRFDRLRVSLEGSSGNELNTGAVGESNTGRLLSRILEPQQFSDVAAARLYQQIAVS